MLPCNPRGAIYFSKQANFNINATFINNTATSQGGAIFFYDDVFNVKIISTVRGVGYVIKDE